MADKAPEELSAFFAKKKKSKVKSLNLNNAPTDKKVDTGKIKMDKEEEGWEDEAVVTSQMKLEIAGKLTREEDNKEEEVKAAGWGSNKQKKGGAQSQALSDKKFPELMKSNKSSNINIDDGSDGKVNIKTSKNAFSALDMGGDSDEESAPRRPKEIKPAMVAKVKGEKEAVSLQREKDKYADKPTKEDSKKKVVEKEADGDESEDDEEEAEDSKPAKVEETKPKKAAKREKEDEEEEAEEEAEIAEDLRITPDMKAAEKKYEGRKKQPSATLPDSEIEDKSASKPKPAMGKKKKAFLDETEDKPKLQYLGA